MKKRFIIIFWVFILINVISCSKSDVKTENKPAPDNIDNATQAIAMSKEDSVKLLLETVKTQQDSIFTDFILEPFTTNIPHRGDCINSLTKLFGQPLKIEKKAWANIHTDNQIDSVYELYYKGIKAGVYKQTKLNYELLLSLELHSANIPLRYDVGINKNIKSLANIFNAVYKKDNDIYYFETVDNGATHNLKIKTYQGTIKEMTFTYYWD